MSRRLSTRHVVLGLMVDRASYGYRLACDLRERLDFMALTESAVYKTLERLEDDGWIEEAGQHPHGATRRGAPRVLYRATDEGAKQFRRWMATPSSRAVVRDELHAKMAIADPDDLPLLLEAAEFQLEECFGELRSLQRPPLGDLASEDVPWATVSRALLDDFQARSLESLVDWLSDLCELLQQRIDRGHGRTAVRKPRP